NAITIFNKTGHDGMFDYKLFNAAGQQLLNGKINMVINGGAVLPLPAQAATGIYLLELSNEKLAFRQKLLIEK
ncbi:MAG TPA: T9SS type A sorting domain-containing protein, partial [Chitinophagaceae bacterium]|nr:T9SS type A sorting domain-containing protein [Chitinophagaceae bacterium]